MEAKEILDTSVAIERKAGVITVFTAIEYPPSMNRNFEVLLPETADYIKAIEISNKLRDKGKPVGAVDIIISSMCINRAMRLVAKDNDFKNIRENFPEFELQSLLK